MTDPALFVAVPELFVAITVTSKVPLVEMAPEGSVTVHWLALPDMANVRLLIETDDWLAFAVVALIFTVYAQYPAV
jgi:hypothetical protein